MDRKAVLMRMAVEFVRGECKRLLDGKFPMDKFVLSKTLRSSYKNPDSIAHKQLADRANDRGTDAYLSNDRIPYVFVVHKEAAAKGQKTLQGDKIETPEQVVLAKLKVDYKHYLLQQIQNPIAQVFALAIEYLDGYNKTKHPQIWEKVYRDQMEKGNGEEIARRKMEEKRAVVAAGLLFDSLVNEYENRLNGRRMMTDFFKKK